MRRKVDWRKLRGEELRTYCRERYAQSISMYPDRGVLMEWRTLSYTAYVIKQVVRLADRRYILRVRGDHPHEEGIWSNVAESAYADRLINRL